MDDQILGYGLFDLFPNGTFTTEDVATILGNVPNDASAITFQYGTAKIYDLGPALFYTHGNADIVGGSALFTTDPLGAFNDFAIYPEGQNDPVDGFVLADTSGTLSGGVGAAWVRNYRVMYPPKTARYIVPHIKLGSVAAGNSQYLDAHQLEVLPVGASAPTAFDSARSINVNVRPARLNWSQNPRGQVSTANWTGVTQVQGGLQCTGGSATHTINNLVPGNVYTASAYVTGNAVVTLEGEDNRTEQVSTTRRISHVFTALATSVTLHFSSTAQFNVTKVLVEDGDVLLPYFDGFTDTSGDYLWEQGGTPGAARSYYYPDRVMRHYVLVRNLQDNVALGMVVNTPQYALLPAPSTSS